MRLSSEQYLLFETAPKKEKETKGKREDKHANQSPVNRPVF